jgi:mutator protein MutT
MVNGVTQDISSNPHPIRRVALAIIRREDRFAVIRRRSGDVLAGMWEFPGGRIEAGESPSHAAVREAFEETGLRVHALRELPATTYEYAHLTVELHAVICELTSPSHEAADVTWASYADLTALPMPAANAKILRLLSAESV